MTINEALEQIGLTKRESLIYLHLLKFGPSSPTQIAAETGIKRPNVYDVLKSLEKDGLIKYQLVSKKKLIAPEPAEKIEELISQKMNLAKSLVPVLKNLDQESSFQGKITFYQGKKAVQNLFNEAMNMKGNELLGLWPAKDMDKILDRKTVEKFITKRIKRKIKLRSLRDASKESFYAEEISEYGKQFTKAAYVPEKYKFSLACQIYDDKVAFYSSKKESYAFVVESKEFYEVIKMFYENLWEHSGKLNQANP